MKKIAVVGTGYVGLVTGTCFAEMGNQVICVDVDQEKLNRLRAGEVPIYEPHLDVLFERNIKAGRLHFTDSLPDAVRQSDLIFLALPTPPGEDGSADLRYVLGVAGELGALIDGFKVIVDKSTVPVGTSRLVYDAIRTGTTSDFAVVSNPEFLREGFAVDDFMKPDRVVIGTDHPLAIEVMKELYKPFVESDSDIIVMDEASAELTKYAANAFLATKITFMNEVANFCELSGANADMVRLGIGADERIGSKFLFPGIGFGGSCFPKDVHALINSGKSKGFDFQILQSVVAVNNQQRIRLIDKLKVYYPSLKGKHFALWGLAFKPDTDDIREASALYMLDELLREGASVRAYDPEAMNKVKQAIGDRIEYAGDPYDALQDADALLIATEWAVFRAPDFEKMKSLLKEAVIFDGRNLFDPERMGQHGFYYNSIGRKTAE